MADETLLDLATQIRAKTLRLIDGVSDELALWTPRGLRNHILWHAGHALVVVEYLGVAAATGKPPIYPEGWFGKFSWESDPSTVTQWPALAEVRAKLVDQLDRFLAAASALSSERLSQPTSDRSAKPLRSTLIHGFHDEANHQGEMHLLKKLKSV